ncbi:MAG: hypothetical protein IPG51_09715 [Chloroflexi bacterium]|nr:hypothetical protein [Chloroflexota bacterium]
MAGFLALVVGECDGVCNGRFLPHTHVHDHICAANGTAVAHSFHYRHAVVGENGRSYSNSLTYSTNTYSNIYSYPVCSRNSNCTTRNSLVNKRKSFIKNQY